MSFFKFVESFSCLFSSSFSFSLFFLITSSGAFFTNSLFESFFFREEIVLIGEDHGMGPRGLRNDLYGTHDHDVNMKKLILASVLVLFWEPFGIIVLAAVAPPLSLSCTICVQI